MKIIATLAALAALSACSTQWSFAEPTDEQIIAARYICGSEADRSAIAAYLEVRGQTVVDLNLPNFGPERAAYCAHRGNRVAALELAE